MILDPVTIRSGVTLTAVVVEGGLTDDPSAVAGDAAGAGSADGSVTLDQDVAGTASGAGDASGAAGLDQGIAGAASGAGDATGDVRDSTDQAIAGAADGTGAADGSVLLDQAIAGAAAGAADASGNVTLAGSGPDTALAGMSFGLGGMYFNPILPMINAAKHGTPWRVASDTLEDTGNLTGSLIDSLGNPVEYPAGGEAYIASGFDWSLPEYANQAGAWVLTWDGTTVPSVVGGAVSNVVATANRIEFDLALPGTFDIRIAGSAGDPIDFTGHRLFKAADETAIDGGQEFRPEFLNILDAYNLYDLRFMDWLETNNSTITDPADRAPDGAATYTRHGVPLEVCVRLAVLTGASGWYCVPHLATDACIDEYATVIRDGTPAGGTIRVEYSNELWNGGPSNGFEQAQYLYAEAAAQWGGSTDVSAMQVKKATNVANRFDAIFGGRASELVHVLAGAQGTNGNALLARADWEANEGPGTADPATTFDEYSVVTYFATAIAGDAGLMAQIAAQPTAALRAQELHDILLDPAVDSSIPQAASEIETDRATCDAAGWVMSSYEGGCHFVHGGGPIMETALTYWNDLVGQTALFQNVIEQWINLSKTYYDRPVMQFVADGPWTQFGTWGAYPEINYAGDGRTAALIAHDASPRYWGADVVPQPSFTIPDQTGDDQTAVNLDLTPYFSTNATGLLLTNAPPGLSASGMSITGTASGAFSGTVQIAATNAAGTGPAQSISWDVTVAQVSGSATGAGSASGDVDLDQTISGDASGAGDAAGDVTASALVVTHMGEGNSLFDWEDPYGNPLGEEGKVHLWMSRFAAEAGQTYSFNGEFFPWNSPPLSSMGSSETSSAGYDGGDIVAFGAIAWRDFSYTSTNFRYGAIGAPNLSPGPGDGDYDDILAQIDVLEAGRPGVTHWVHFGWPEMAPFGDPRIAPLTTQQWSDYKAFALGDYADYTDALVAALQAARPALDIRMIDCNRPFIDVLENELSALGSNDVAADDAPHGTATMYFLNSVIFYRAVFGQLPPLSYTIPATVNAAVAANWTAIRARIESWFTGATTLAGSAAGTGAAAGSVDLDQSAAGGAAGSGDAVGDLGLDQTIGGDASGAADASGSLAAGDTLSGSATGSGDATGDVSLDQAVSGAAAGAGDAAGDATLDQGISGAAAGSGTATGDVTAGASAPPAVTFDGTNDYLNGFGLSATATEFTIVLQVNGAYGGGEQILNMGEPFTLFFNAADSFAWFIGAVSGVGFGFDSMPNAANNDATIMIAVSQSGVLPGGNTLQIHIDGTLVLSSTGAVTTVDMSGLHVFAGEAGGTPFWATDAYRLWASDAVALDGSDPAIWGAFATGTHGPAALPNPATVDGNVPDVIVQGDQDAWNTSGYMNGAVVDA